MEIKIKIDENRQVNKNKFFFGNRYENNVTKVFVEIPKDVKYNLYLFYYPQGEEKRSKQYEIGDDFLIPQEITETSGIFNAYIISSDAQKGGNIFEGEHVFISNEFKFEIKEINLKGGGSIVAEL